VPGALSHRPPESPQSRHAPVDIAGPALIARAASAHAASRRGTWDADPMTTRKRLALERTSLSVLGVILVVDVEGGEQHEQPSKSALSKAGRTLSSNSSSKAAKSKAGLTLGKG
jgi:hypothetical protein